MLKLVAVIGAVAAFLAANQAAFGQDRQEPPQQYRALVACRAQADAAARLRCYDQAVAAFEQATRSGDVLLTGREDVRQARRSLFGFPIPRFLRARDNSDEPEVRELRTTIVSARDAGFEQFILVLAEGGRWQTLDSSRGAPPPRPGTAVIVRRGALSYFIDLPGIRPVRARRLE